MWVAVVCVLVPLPFLIWFGVYPLWLRQHLKRAGVPVTGKCRTISTSEGRYSTSFEFVTPSGRHVIYRSPLSGGSWGEPGREAVLVYDPRHPHRFVRSRRELNASSEALFSLGVLTVAEIVMLLGMVLVVLHNDAKEFTDLTGAVTGRPPPANALAIVQGEDRLLGRVVVISRLTGGDAVIATKLGRNEARFLAHVLGAT